MQLVEPIDASRRFFADTSDRIPLADEPSRRLGKSALDLGKEALLFFRLRIFDQVGLAFFDPRAEKDIESRIASIVENHVCALVAEGKDSIGKRPVFFESLPLEGKHRRPGFGDRRRCMILGRKDVA